MGCAALAHSTLAEAKSTAKQLADPSAHPIGGLHDGRPSAAAALRPSQISMLQRSCAGDRASERCSCPRRGDPEKAPSLSGVSQHAAQKALETVRRGGGHPLDEHLRDDMEARLGWDFSTVRIHTDHAAARSAAGIHARAYTVDGAVAFAAGAFKPDTSEGRRTLAHELVHVQQQREGRLTRADARGGIAISQPEDRFEREAEVCAERALRHLAPSRVPTARGVVRNGGVLLQRQQDPTRPVGSSSPPAPEVALPMGAPPTIIEEVESGPQSPSRVGLTISTQAQQQGSGGSGAGGAGRSGAGGFACQHLTWQDYPPANPPGPYEANTGFVWSQRGSQFSARFDRKSSWVRPKWRSDTSDASKALLRHEQYHLSLVCLLAAKATAAVASGAPVASVVRQMRDAVNRYTTVYDEDTQHGTNATLQNQWVADIDSGNVEFPVSGP